MKKKEVKLVFNFPIDQFSGEMRNKISFIKRDQEQFAGYGISSEDVAGVEAEITRFDDMPTDKELEGYQVAATQEKDAAAIELRSLMTGVLTRAESKWGKESGRYKMFGVNGVSHLDGWSLSTASNRVGRVAKNQLSDLESEGLTAEILQELKAKQDEYVARLEAQEDAIANRDIATEDRMELANTIYRQVAKWCNTGTKIWQSTNEAKYNDYVIYGTTSGDVKEEIPAEE